MSLAVVIYACQQAVPEPERLRTLMAAGGIRPQVISEPCSSKVEAFQMLRTLATPSDLVWVIGCAENLCRFQEGSRRLAGRVAYSRRYLEEIGLEADRLDHSLITPGDEAVLAATVEKIKARAQALGHSPLKKKKK